MAAKFFLDALKMKSNDPLANLGLGNSYYLGRKIPEAKAAFERVLDTSPGVREAQEQLAALKSLARKKTTRTVIYKRSPQKTQPQRKRR